MARQNGQLTWITPCLISTNGDSTTAAAKVRLFAATERVTVVEVGAISHDSTTTPTSDFSFRVLKRDDGVAANDTVIPVWTAAFAAQGGIAGDPSVQNFDNANAISGGIIENTAGDLTAGKCLRAFTETSLDKGDSLIFEVVGTSASDTVLFYAKCYADGAGLVEENDVDSN